MNIDTKRLLMKYYLCIAVFWSALIRKNYCSRWYLKQRLTDVQYVLRERLWRTHFQTRCLLWSPSSPQGQGPFWKKRQKIVKAKVDRRSQGSFILQTQQYWYANKITETKAAYTRPEKFKADKTLTWRKGGGYKVTPLNRKLFKNPTPD